MSQATDAPENAVGGNTGTPPLSEAELLALWVQGRRIARHRCAHTLASLQDGDGGFYDVDDFWQDLFLVFRDYVLRWWRTPERSEAALWEAWHRALHWEGRDILRRRPQRLWFDLRRRVPLAALASEKRPGASEHGGQPDTVHPALVDAATPEREHTSLQDVAALETAMWRLLPVQRQVLYLCTLEGLSTAEVARCLFGGDIKQVHRHLYRARRALARALGQAPADDAGRPWGDRQAPGENTRR